MTCYEGFSPHVALRLLVTKEECVELPGVSVCREESSEEEWQEVGRGRTLWVIQSQCKVPPVQPE